MLYKYNIKALKKLRTCQLVTLTPFNTTFDNLAILLQDKIIKSGLL